MVNKSKDIQNKRSKILPWVLGTILIVVLILGGIVYFQGSDVITSEKRISEVLNDPNNYLGKQVTLTGEVGTIIGLRAFTMTSPDPLAGDLLVISKESLEPIGGGGPQDYLIDNEDRISISGTVREFNIREIERALGEDLIDNEFLEYEGRPVVIADNVDYER